MPRERGFTLIELMVVIVILGGLIGLVGINVFKAQEDSDRTIAEAQMSNLAEAVQAYRIQARRLPSSLEDLTARTDARPEPYFRSLPKDPWGQAYEYRPEGSSTFTLRSPGKDGAAGTDDDVIWPHPEH